MVVSWADLIWWSGLAVEVLSDGLILVVQSDDGLVGVGAWSDLWSGSETHLIVWCDGLIWGGSYALMV